MRSRYTIHFLLTLIAIVGAFLVLRSSNAVAAEVPCKESMDASCEKKSSSDKMIWENLSQQFFSTF
jgi:hypothetical protein